jgi:formylglycine-generating enzyme required for sulfatase activity
MRTRAGIGGLVLVLLLIGVAWWQQDVLKEQYQWRIVMGPSVLTPAQERALARGQQFSECTLGCPTMVVIPAGSFTMGSLENEKDRSDHEGGPQHTVTIGKRFAAGKVDVSFAEWDACVDPGACPPASAHGWDRDHRSVNVSWNDAQLYVAWLSGITGKQYRLLSEAEWEYAARAGSATAYSWGDDIGEGNANCYGCGSQWDDKQTSPVGSFEPNAFGLYDMHGNVWQWVEDVYHDNYHGAPDDGSAWIDGGDTSRRVVRGGSWRNGPGGLRAASRVWGATIDRSYDLGFRLGRTLTP